MGVFILKYLGIAEVITMNLIEKENLIRIKAE